MRCVVASIKAQEPEKSADDGKKNESEGKFNQIQQASRARKPEASKY
jgi:hypothetical protein